MEAGLEQQPLLHEGAPGGAEIPDANYARNRRAVQNMSVDYLVDCDVEYRKQIEEKNKLGAYGKEIRDDLSEWVTVSLAFNGLLTTLIYNNFSNYGLISIIFSIINLLGMICVFVCAYKKWWLMEMMERDLKTNQERLLTKVDVFLESCEIYNVVTYLDFRISTGVTQEYLERMKVIQKDMKATSKHESHSEHFWNTFVYLSLQALACAFIGPFACYFPLYGGNK